VEHPKDIGDVSTLAITLVLRALGYGARVLKRTYHGEIDAFAVYCPDTAGVYLIPIAHLPVEREGRLRMDPPKNNQFDRVRFAADYEVGRIAIEGLRVSSGA
jgi:PD-(D/E)XK endonuclease